MSDANQTNRPVGPLATATAAGRFIPGQPALSSGDANQTNRPVDPLVAATAVGRFVPEQPAQSSKGKKRRRRQQARGPPDDDDDDDGGGAYSDAYSIATFCKRHAISESFYHKLRSQGLGPKTMRVGSRVLITREAARAWRKQRTEASAI